MTADFLIIGGGVIGLGLALEAKRRHPGACVVLLEKEASCGEHASGRNSGVLHAGFYYTADSLKARFCRDGNAALTRYCEDRALRLNRCGKLVVARDESDWAGMDELLRRARINGVELHEVTEAEARELEPGARTAGRALFSPSTSSVDPSEVVAALERDARAAGVEVRTGTAYLGRTRAAVRTSAGEISAGLVLNAAGLYADRVARDFGFGEGYSILPFKGLYLYAADGQRPVARHVYPVPDLGNPFLGVHLTVTVDGRVKLGPTATPAFWRENYRGLENFSAAELRDVVAREAGLFLRDDFGFRSLAFRELRKHSPRRLVADAARLAPGLRAADFAGWGRAGIRAQLLDLRSRRLEMDFVVEGDDRSLHVLNAVSPAFTCALPFCEWVWERIP